METWFTDPLFRESIKTFFRVQLKVPVLIPNICSNESRNKRSVSIAKKFLCSYVDHLWEKRDDKRFDVSEEEIVWMVSVMSALNHFKPLHDPQIVPSSVIENLKDIALVKTGEDSFQKARLRGSVEALMAEQLNYYKLHLSK